MTQLNESAYESGIFSGIGPLGIGKPPPVHAFREGSLGTLGKPPPAYAYREGSLGILSGAGGLGKPPPVYAFREGSLGDIAGMSLPTAIGVAAVLGVAGWLLFKK